MAAPATCWPLLIIDPFHKNMEQAYEYLEKAEQNGAMDMDVCSVAEDLYDEVVEEPRFIDLFDV